MEIKITEIKGRQVIELQGEIYFYCIEELKQLLFKMIKKKTASIILDLANVAFMDSSGVGLIFKAYKSMSAYNGSISLVNVNSEILELLELATVDSLVKIYGGIEEIDGLK